MSFNPNRLFLGDIRCTTEGCTNRAYDLYQDESSRQLKAACTQHKPPKKDGEEVPPSLTNWSISGGDGCKLIESVVIHALDEYRTDRRGRIATFNIKEGVRGSWSARRVIELAQILISTLQSGYAFDAPGREGEQSDCWIRDEINTVSIGHKYWSQPQVDCFRELIRALARHHGWELQGMTNGLLEDLVAETTKKTKRKRSR